MDIDSEADSDTVSKIGSGTDSGLDSGVDSVVATEIDSGAAVDDFSSLPVKCFNRFFKLSKILDILCSNWSVDHNFYSTLAIFKVTQRKGKPCQSRST